MRFLFCAVAERESPERAITAWRSLLPFFEPAALDANPALALVLADGSEVRMPTETIYREGESPAKGSAAKIGGAAVGGAILGAIMGGGKGAVIGAATGAGSGTGWAMAGDRRPAELRSGQALAVRVSDSVTTEIVR